MAGVALAGRYLTALVEGERSGCARTPFGIGEAVAQTRRRRRLAAPWIRDGRGCGPSRDRKSGEAAGVRHGRYGSGRPRPRPPVRVVGSRGRAGGRRRCGRRATALARLVGREHPRFQRLVPLPGFQRHRRRSRPSPGLECADGGCLHGTGSDYRARRGRVRTDRVTRGPEPVQHDLADMGGPLAAEARRGSRRRQRGEGLAVGGEDGQPQPVDDESPSGRTDLHHDQRDERGDGAGCAARSSNHGRLSDVVAGDCPCPHRALGRVDRAHAKRLVACNRRGHEGGLPTSGATLRVRACRISIERCGASTTR